MLNLRPTAGIYVGAKDVFLAQFKQTILGPRLSKFGKAEIQAQPQSDESVRVEAIVQAIRKVVQENNISSNKVNLALPGKDVLIRYFQMPKIPKQEWETAIKFEAKKYIPFKIEELMWDFHVVLLTGKSNRMDVTFVAVKKEIAQKYLVLLQKASLEAAVLEPAPFSLVRLFAVNKQLARDKPTAIVDVDYGMADINIAKNRMCYLTRDISLPLEEEVIFDSLLNEVRMSLEYYEKLFPADVVDKILLCGETQLKDWDRSLSGELKLPVHKVVPTRILMTKNVPAPLNMPVAIGLALRGLTYAVVKVNLLQRHEVKAKLELAEQGLTKLTPEIRRAVLRAVGFSCILLLTLHFIMLPRLNAAKKQLEKEISLRSQLDSTISSLPDSELEQMKRELEVKTSILSLIITKRIFWTTKFNELPKVIPPGIWLTKLSFSDKLVRNDKLVRDLAIQGVAYHEDPGQDIDLVTKFVSNLKKNKKFSKEFRQVKLNAMTSAKLQEISIKNFVISCESN